MFAQGLMKQRTILIRLENKCPLRSNVNRLIDHAQDHQTSTDRIPYATSQGSQYGFFVRYHKDGLEKVSDHRWGQELKTCFPEVDKEEWVSGIIQFKYKKPVTPSESGIVPPHVPGKSWHHGHQTVQSSIAFLNT